MGALEELMKERGKAAENNPQETDPPVVVEEKVVTDPPADDQPAVVKTDSFDFSELGVKDYDELKNQFNTFKSNNEKLTEYEQRIANELAEKEQLKQAVDKYKDDLEKVYIPDPEDLKLAILKKQDKEKYKVVSKILDTTELGDNDLFDLVKMEAKLEFPNKSDKQIEIYLKNKYGLNAQKPDDEDEYAVEQYNEKIEVAKMEIESNARKFRDKLIGEFNAIQVPTKTVITEEQIAIEKANAKNSWTPVLQPIVEHISKEVLTVKDGEELVNIDFKLTTEQTKELNEVISKYVYDNKISYSDKTLEHVAREAKNYVIIATQKNREQAIWDAAMKHASKKIDSLRESKGIKSEEGAGKTGSEAYQAFLADLKQRVG